MDEETKSIMEAKLAKYKSQAESLSKVLEEHKKKIQEHQEAYNNVVMVIMKTNERAAELNDLLNPKTQS